MMNGLDIQMAYQMGKAKSEQMRAPAPAHAGTRPDAKEIPPAIQKAARDYEAVFINQMLEHMYAGVETDSMFGGGEAEKTFRSILLQEYGQKIADRGGIGIAQHMARELLAAQEAANKGVSQ